MPIQGSQRRLDVMPCLARTVVATMLWNAIPIIVDRIMGLSVAMPGSCLMANAVPAITQFRNRRGSRPVHRWMVDGRRALVLSSCDAASSVLEIEVMSWL